ncbi:MAG: hypothetical protein JXN61_03575 [Sedimentisphaerales bacterium]|nr:hypothetical protein [Sedimentisphaerales bacterium]
MLCWLYKFMISNAVDAGDQLSPATQRHIENCPHCRGFHQVCLSLGEGLSREAAENSGDDELLADFGRRVLTATTVARHGRAERFALPIRWRRPALAAACIAVAALIGVQFMTSSPNEPPVAVPARIDGLYKLMGDGHPTAWAGFVEKPLAEEIENLTQNTESAARFLVACVKVQPTQARYKPD